MTPSTPVPLGTIVFDTGSISGEIHNFTVNSDTEITATAPAGTGLVDVVVTTPGGSSPTVGADQYSYQPIVAGINPGFGTAAGGTTVTIDGSNFTGANAVDFGTTAATTFKVNSDTQVTATSPPGSGIVDVVVVTGGGSSQTSNADQFSYAPVVSSLTPSAGPATGGTSVTVSGFNFTGATAVDFGAVPAASFSVTNDGTLTAAAPPGNSPHVPVTVTGPGGASTANPGAVFSYGPVVATVKPKFGVGSGGEKVVIIGSNFKAVNAVNFGSTAAASFSLKSSTKIVAIAPAGTGIVDVTVQSAAGTSPVVLTDQFNYGPSVSHVLPNGGPIAGGTKVIVLGTNFNGVTGVNFGGNPAPSFTVLSPTKIKVVVPPAALSPVVDVTVVTLGGTSPTNPADQFTYG